MVKNDKRGRKMQALMLITQRAESPVLTQKRKLLNIQKGKVGRRGGRDQV